MNWFDSWALTLTILIPGVTAVAVMLIPRAEEEAIKWVSLLGSVATLGVLIGILSDFDYDRSSKLQFDVNKEWIPVINSRYHVAVDGISLPLLALSAFITVLCVVYSWNHFPEPHNPKAFLILILILEIGMNGTFIAQDLILFFVFFEVVLLPMFFMIGVWGGPNREYASIKFFLFTLFGSALMLLGFLALYFKVDVLPDVAGAQHSFDMVLLTRAAGSGLDVRLRLEGEREGLPADVAQTAYRVVQEGLTNALRYASGAAVTVVVRGEQGALVIDVENGRAPDDPSASLAGTGTGVEPGSTSVSE